MQDEELQSQLQIYTQQLNEDVKRAKIGLYTFVSEWLGEQQSQGLTRRMSWLHSRLCEQDGEYNKKCKNILKDLPTPVPVGTSTQDAYHHSHLVNAVLLALSQPYQPLPVTPPAAVMKTCSQYTGTDEVERLELLERLYLTLSNLIPKDTKHASKSIIKASKTPRASRTSSEEFQLIMESLEEIKDLIRGTKTD